LTLRKSSRRERLAKAFAVVDDADGFYLGGKRGYVHVIRTRSWAVVCLTTPTTCGVDQPRNGQKQDSKKGKEVWPSRQWDHDGSYVRS
jgi:hypothetical protein